MNIAKKTLSNGLRVVLVPQKDAVTATVLVLVGTGSNKETKSQDGLSHFLEHVCFKGTTARPTAKLINEAFEEIGAITNAFTGEEYTGYYAKSNPRHAEKIVGMVGDIVMNATLPAVEIEKEKGVVIEEINMYEDMPNAKVVELLSSILYGDTPAGRPIIGTKESVRAFTQSAVMKYKKQYYVGKNAVVAVVGCFDEATMLQTIKKTFAPFESGVAHAPTKVSVTTKTPRAITLSKPIDQTHIAIAFPSVPLGHADAPTTALLSTILGGGMSSRLFHHLREELGVAYYVRAHQDSHSTYGEFVITAGIDTSRLKEILEAIKTILQTIKKEPVPAAELSKAREFSIGMLGMGLEATDMIAGFVATGLLLQNKIKMPEQITKKYMGVTVEDIRRVANTLFTSKKIKIAAVGPAVTSEEIAAIFDDL